MREMTGVGLPEEKALLGQLKKPRKLTKYGHRKGISERLVMTVTEAEIEMFVIEQHGYMM